MAACCRRTDLLGSGGAGTALSGRFAAPGRRFGGCRSAGCRLHTRFFFAGTERAAGVRHAVSRGEAAPSGERLVELLRLEYPPCGVDGRLSGKTR